MKIYKLNNGYMGIYKKAGYHYQTRVYATRLEVIREAIEEIKLITGLLTL
jgi:hypothetical protein